MTGAPPSVLFLLADGLEALEFAVEGLLEDQRDVSAAAVGALERVVRDLHIAIDLIEPDLDRLAQAAAGILEDG